jgi:hypothetical protein
MTSVIPDHVQKVLDEPPPSTEAAFPVMDEFVIVTS